jgi:hypothetical protein
MTEAEAVEAATAFWNLFITMMTLYLSATSGYLVVAYLVGGKLTFTQVFTISCLYVLFALFSVYGSVGFALRGIDYVAEMMKHRPDALFFGRAEGVTFLAILLVSGIFASLKFMWDVRRA